MHPILRIQKHFAGEEKGLIMSRVWCRKKVRSDDGGLIIKKDSGMNRLGKKWYVIED